MHGAKVVLLHAVPDIINEAIPEHYKDLADAEHVQIGDVLVAIGDEILGGAKSRLLAQGADIIESVMPHGPPAQAILDYVKDHPVDLIVMGSRGLSNLEGLMLGSVSHKVSHLAPCSCVTVR